MTSRLRWGTRRDGGAEALADVRERVGQCQHLHPADRVQRAPGEERAAEPQQWSQQDREHGGDAARVDGGPEEQSKAGTHERGQRRDGDEDRPVDVQVRSGGGDEHGEREYDDSGEQTLYGADDDLLHRDEPGRQWCQHAIVDLSRVSEVLHERQGDGEYALKQDHHGQHPGQQRGGDLARAASALGYTAHLGDDVTEHEHDQQRLHDGTSEKLGWSLPEHGEVAGEEGDECGASRRAARSRRQRAGNRLWSRS